MHKFATTFLCFKLSSFIRKCQRIVVLCVWILKLRLQGKKESVTCSLAIVIYCYIMYVLIYFRVHRVPVWGGHWWVCLSDLSSQLPVCRWCQLFLLCVSRGQDRRILWQRLGTVTSSHSSVKSLFMLYYFSKLWTAHM